MVKLVLTIISFLKEIMFGKTEELNITSVHFSFKSYIFFITFVLSLTLNIFLMSRIYNIAVKYNNINEASEELNTCNTIKEEQEDMIVRLNRDIYACINNARPTSTNGKKHHTEKYSGRS